MFLLVQNFQLLLQLCFPALFVNNNIQFVTYLHPHLRRAVHFIETSNSPTSLHRHRRFLHRPARGVLRDLTLDVRRRIDPIGSTVAHALLVLQGGNPLGGGGGRRREREGGAGPLVAEDLEFTECESGRGRRPAAEVGGGDAMEVAAVERDRHHGSASPDFVSLSKNDH